MNWTGTALLKHVPAKPQMKMCVCSESNPTQRIVVDRKDISKAKIPSSVKRAFEFFVKASRLESVLLLF